MKKKIIAVLIATMMFGSTLTVDAAGLKDIFNAKYYADQYQDLKDAFGYDGDALYQHFLKYGLAEGRVMNPIIDVVKYREEYGDLDIAFGDDWDAYVNHFFAYGIKENRENGTDFDIKAYVEAYGDIKEAFGDDYLAIAEHYMEHGIKENRVEASKTVIAARQEAAKPTPSPEEERLNGVYTDYNADGSWNVKEYRDGRILRHEYYTAEGALFFYITYEYNTEGKLLLEIYYDADNVAQSTTEYTYNADGSGSKKQTQASGYYEVTEFDADGKTTAHTSYNEDGGRFVDVYVDGKVISGTGYDSNGEIWATSEYTYDESGTLLYYWYHYVYGEKTVCYVDAIGNPTKAIWYYADGTYRVSLYTGNETYWSVARETTYDSTDAILNDKVYMFEAGTGERIGYKVYDGQGNLIEEVIY